MNVVLELRRRPWLVDVGAAAGAAVVIAVTIVALTVLPDAASAAAVRHFYDEFSIFALLAVVALTIFFFGQLWTLGWLTDLVRRLEKRVDKKSTPYTWITFGAELMFMTVFNVEIGVWATAHLLHARIGDEILYVLHVMGFVIAAPVTFAGVAYFVALLALHRRTATFPPHVAAVAALGVVGNLAAMGGLFTVSGPLNAASGWLAIGGPMLVWSLWYAVAPGWYLRAESTQLT